MCVYARVVCVCGQRESQENLSCVSMPVSYVSAGGVNLWISWRACLCPCCMCVRAAPLPRRINVCLSVRLGDKKEKVL